MDLMKKRKIEDNNVVVKVDPDAFNPLVLTVDDARKILEPLTHEQLSEIVQHALLRHHDVFDAVRSFADRDITQRKLFIRGLSWETTTEKLRTLFSSYGELDEAVVILDKVTGKSKGFGFITFKHVDGAIMALKESSKQIDGKMTVTQLASSGNSNSGGSAPAAGGNSPVDVSSRKIYVSNVPYDMPSERLLQHFSMYGEVEEGPVGFDKVTGKSKGFALFVYKTAEAARKSLVDPMKNIDGYQLNCKLAASDGKKGNPVGVGSMGPSGDGTGATMQYGGPGGGFSGILGAGVGGTGVSAIGNQGAGSNLGGVGSGICGPYGHGSHFGGPMGGMYGGLGGSSGVLGPRAGDGYAGVAGRGPSLYGMPPSSAGTGSGDYHQGGAHYGVNSSGYPGQHNQPAAAFSAPRVPSGGVYQARPHYY